MFRSRPGTAELSGKLAKIERCLPGPFNPKELCQLIVEGRNKLEMEVDVALNSKEVYLMRDKEPKTSLLVRGSRGNQSALQIR